MKYQFAQATQESGACTGSGITLEAGPENVAGSVRQQRVFLELTETRQALSKSQRESKSACRKIETLTKANSHLKRELRRLAQKEAQARTFAYHDALTGLPNRRLLQDRLSQAIALGARQHTRVVLLLLDLDDFKSINDWLGHAAGDKVLRAVAQRLAAGIRGADTACRYGGDEFVIMLPEVVDARMAAAVSEKLRRALSAPYLVDGFEIRLTASAGSVVYPYEGKSSLELMEKADVALYHAKARSGKVSITTLPTHSIAKHSRSLTMVRSRPKVSTGIHRVGTR